MTNQSNSGEVSLNGRRLRIGQIAQVARQGDGRAGGVAIITGTPDEGAVATIRAMAGALKELEHVIRALRLGPLRKQALHHHGVFLRVTKCAQIEQIVSPALGQCLHGPQDTPGLVPLIPEYLGALHDLVGPADILANQHLAEEPHPEGDVCIGDTCPNRAQVLEATQERPPHTGAATDVLTNGGDPVLGEGLVG